MSAVCLQKLRKSKQTAENWEKVNKQLTEKCKQTADCLQNLRKSKQTAEKCKQSQLFVYKKLRKCKQTAVKSWERVLALDWGQLGTKKPKPGFCWEM